MNGLIVAFSGGKDSTAMALRLAELGEGFSLLFTPTGDELPELFAHLDRMLALLGRPLIQPPNLSLDHWIRTWNALPNWRQRWCTRAIKIEPCIAYLKANPGTTLAVGLRADEEDRGGLYGDFASYRYPLREWGWGLGDVQGYLQRRGVKVPARTDCAVCPYQNLVDWFRLWREHPEAYARGEEYEALTGHTFRSDSRDTWAAALKDLRVEFETGRRPRGFERVDQGDLFDGPVACRVCSL
jgi:3'-phosphoadenosine 5'-phosphosulfate sulfotransferase (PAPS reductase)/FAD synthetase